MSHPIHLNIGQHIKDANGTKIRTGLFSYGYTSNAKPIPQAQDVLVYEQPKTTTVETKETP